MKQTCDSWRFSQDLYPTRLAQRWHQRHFSDDGCLGTKVTALVACCQTASGSFKKCLELRRKIRIWSWPVEWCEVDQVICRIGPLRFNWFQVFTCNSYIHMQLISCIYISYNIYINIYILIYIIYNTYILLPGSDARPKDRRHPRQSPSPSRRRRVGVPDSRGISDRFDINNWLVVWNIVFSIYWECHHPIWRTHFFRGSKHQPAKIVYDVDFWGSTNWFWSTPARLRWLDSQHLPGEQPPGWIGWFWCCAAIRLSIQVKKGSLSIEKQGTSLDSRQHQCWALALRCCPKDQWIGKYQLEEEGRLLESQRLITTEPWKFCRTVD